jgi:penicillin-binding protein 1A
MSRNKPKGRRSTSPWWLRWLRRLLVLGAVLTALGIAAGMVGYRWLEARLPDVFTWQGYTELATEPSRVYAADGALVARYGAEIRTVVPIDRVPRTMLSAIVCAEDAAFYNHPGLDILGIARALYVDVVQGRYAQGASTITQQFAKNWFLSSEKTIVRKLNELVLARKLEQRLTKDEILAMYVNEIYFGHGRYGVEEAARYYFGKPVAQVDVAEAAMLAGVVNAPARFSPFRHPDRARRRRSYVIGQMRERGYISPEDARRAEERPLPTEPHDALTPIGPWYLSEVRKALAEHVDRAQLERDGLRVEIALDTEIQRAAEAAVTDGLRDIDARFRLARPLRHYDDQAAIEAALARLRKQQTPKQVKSGRVVLGIVTRREGDPRRGDCVDHVALGHGQGRLTAERADRYRDEAGALPWGPGDLIRVSTIRTGDDGVLELGVDLGPQAALVALEPQSRLVRAMVGGDDFASHPFNRATQARRQPGSTFKPFVYGAAIEAGEATPDTEVRDSKRTYDSRGRPWTPRNYSGRYDEELHTLRDALARSINSIAVEVAHRVGVEKVADFARRLGIESPLDARLPLALGASDVRPIELANAYATISSEGMRGAPILLTRIVDRRGRDLHRVPRSALERVIPATTARALIDMLGEVVRRGSARSAHVGRPVAGKTGTSNRSRDAWFVGFSARLVAAVWVGHDDRKPIEKGSGARLALPIWASFMRAALDRVPVRPLPRLPHVPGARLDTDPLPDDPELPTDGRVEDGTAEEGDRSDGADEGALQGETLDPGVP